MTLFRKLVVLIDTDPASRRVLGVARALSAHWQVPALLVTAVTSDEAVEDARRRLEEDAEGFARPVDIEVHRGSSVRAELLAVLHRESGAVAVMATHAQHPVRQLLLGSVADDLVRKSPLPILLVGPKVVPPPPDGYSELVACLDGTERSSNLLGMARHAAELNMRTVLLEVRKSAHRTTNDDPGPDVETAPADGIAINHVLVHSDRASQGILEVLAERAHSLPVIATEGRDPYDRLRAPSTALAVTREASVPVLIVGPSCRATWSDDQRLERA